MKTDIRETMLRFSKHFLTLSALLFLGSGVIAQPTGTYQAGVALRDSGHWQEALATWTNGADSLRSEGRADLRMAIATLELTGAKEAGEFYEPATLAYYRALDSEQVTNQEVLAAEVGRVAPLLPPDEAKTWQKLARKSDPALLRKMKAFWVQKDPIPTTRLNERLIEHWRRIALARAKFKGKSTTPYGADDRALVYVKYGPPEIDYSTKLGLSQQEIIRWIDDFLLRQEIQRFNNTPEVEIWVYQHLVRGESTIFFFGRKGGSGKYGLRYGVEDFIPSRAFRRNSTETTQGLLPGSMLQLMYYRELIDVDHFFLDRFRRLEARWSNARSAGAAAPDYNVLLGLLSHFRGQDEGTASFKSLPPDFTSAFESLEGWTLAHRVFRYLDDSEQPRVEILAASGPPAHMAVDLPDFFKRSRKTKYKTRHILVPYDKDWNQQTPVVHYPDLQGSTTSVFDMPQPAPGLHFALVGEKLIMQARKRTLEEKDLPDTARVIGIGSVFLDDLQPLNTAPGEFEASDLLIGKPTPAEVSQSGRHPFPVIPANPILGPRMQVFVRLYNLQPSEKGATSYKIDCEAVALKADGRHDKKHGHLRRKLSFQAPAKDASRAFWLDVSGLKQGPYELTLKIEDAVSHRRVTRRGQFVVGTES